MPVAEKVCPGCGIQKSLDAFGPDRRRGDGRQSHCRRCKADAELARKNRDRECYNAALRSPEKRRARNERLRQKRLNDPAWREQQISIARARYDRRARGGLTKTEIGDGDGWTCYLCGEHVAPDGAHVDHIVAEARGGTNVRGNLAITHGVCNRRKRDLPVCDLAWAVPSALGREAAAVLAMQQEQIPDRRGRRMTRLAWTSDEDAVLARLWDEATWTEITEATGRSVHAIRHRATALGLPKAYRRSTALRSRG